VLDFRYSDDEEGSPWTLILHLDERGDDRQREALAAILLGELDGEHVLSLPWVRKPSEAIAVQSSPIEIQNGSEGYAIRVGSAVSVRASRPVDDQPTVSCIVPGHERVGVELYADEMVAHDGPFDWELTGRCAYASSFDYSGAVPNGKGAS
jgi:hypothetical protein